MADAGRHCVSIGRRDVVLALVLMAIVLAVYAPVARFGPVSLDDFTYLGDNPIVRPGLSVEGVRWAFGTFVLGNYMPVPLLSFLVDASVWSSRAGPIHLENVALHAVSTALWYVLFAGLTGFRGRSFMMAALFALHPMRVEPVAWISDRCDMLCMTFMVGTLLAYTGYCVRNRRRRYALALVLYAMAVLSKPISMVLPAVMLLLNFWPLKRLDVRSKWRTCAAELAPFAAMAVVSAGLGFYGRLTTHASQSLQKWGIADRLNIAVMGYCRYLVKFIWPEPMTPLYPLRRIDVAAPNVAAIFLLLFVSVVAQQARRRWPAVWVGWLWFLATLLPVIGFAQSGGQAIADRYAYLPYMGLSLAVVWPAGMFLRRWFASNEAVLMSVGATVGAVVLLACAIDTRHQLGYWLDGYTLMRHADDLAPDNTDVAASMGNEYRYRNQIDLAAEAYARSVAADPGNAMAQNNFGCLLMPADPARALPHLVAATRAKPGDASYWFNRAQCERQLNLADAPASFARARAIDPSMK